MNKLPKLPQSWLFSDSFLKRSFAILGHYISAVVIIYLGGVVVFMVGAFLATIISAIIN